MTIPLLATMLCALLFLIEKMMPKRRKSKSARDWDKASSAVIRLASAIVPVGVLIGFTDIGRVQTWRGLIAASGVLLALVGVVIRWRAILTLKKYFTLNVTILDDHRIVKNGLYKNIRHPSYTGFLLRYLGGGLAFANWLSLIIIFLPMCAAILYRIHVEEGALTEAFGSEYMDYAKGTNRLIPKVY
jgi:protein-S-isoprenylcysteine O-methyltransferase Ste14